MQRREKREMIFGARLANDVLSLLALEGRQEI
jgi:hypothetical protein